MGCSNRTGDERVNKFDVNARARLSEDVLVDFVFGAAWKSTKYFRETISSKNASKSDSFELPFRPPA